MFEDLAVTFDPIDGLLQSFRFQFAWAPLRIDVHRDEAGALGTLDVLNGWLALSNGWASSVTVASPFAAAPAWRAGGVGQSGEGRSRRSEACITVWYLTFWLYTTARLLVRLWVLAG